MHKIWSSHLVENSTRTVHIGQPWNSIKDDRLVRDSKATSVTATMSTILHQIPDSIQIRI